MLSRSTLTLCRLAAAGVVLVLASSCLNTEQEVGTSRDPNRYAPTPEGARARLTERSVLRTVTASRTFSSPKAKDTFILQLRGPKILNAQAHFIIVSGTGDTLRKEVLPARALLDERLMADPQTATVRAQEIAILQGMNAFFREDKFTKPAVPRALPQPEDVDAQAWQAVKEDARAVGFDYVTADGRERRLAFAKKLGKAVIVAE